MNHAEKYELVEILKGPPFQVRSRLQDFIDTVVVEDTTPRTSQQNKALHKWYEEVAKVCNENGVDAKMVMTKVIRMDMTAAFIKEMWRALQRALFQKKSTTQLYKSGEIDRIRDHFIRFFANEFQLELPPFPSQETKVSKIPNTSIDYPETYEQPLI